MYLDEIAAIVLAGGKGTRMGSNKPKPLHFLGGKPMLFHTIKHLKKAEISKIEVVVSYKKEAVKKAISELIRCGFVNQSEPTGTAHAVKCALTEISPLFKAVLVLNGDDSAFYKPETFKTVIHNHTKNNKKMTVVTTICKGTKLNSRVIRDRSGKFLGFRNIKDIPSDEVVSNHEVITGFYIFNRGWLEENIKKIEIGTNGEYNLPTLIRLALREGQVNDFMIDDSREWQSINDKEELYKARKLWKKLQTV